MIIENLTLPPAAVSIAFVNLVSFTLNKEQTKPLTLDLSKFGSGSLYSKFSCGYLKINN